MIMTYIPRYFTYVKRGQKCEYFGPLCPDISYWQVLVHLQQYAHSFSNSRYVECDSLVLLNPSNTLVIQVCYLFELPKKKKVCPDFRFIVLIADIPFGS